MSPLEESLLGQIEALTELVYALSLQVDRDKFKSDALMCLRNRLQAHRAAPMASEARLQAIERFEAWVRMNASGRVDT